MPYAGSAQADTSEVYKAPLKQAAPMEGIKQKENIRFRLPTAVYLKAPLSALLELLFAFWKPP
jgi:hypothetical protein